MGSLTQVMLIALLGASVIAHPSVYAERNATCIAPVMPEVLSWHIHLLFHQTNEEHTKGAVAIRKAYEAEFGSILGPDCQDTFAQTYNCMFPTIMSPDGPFLTGQWAIFLLPDSFYDTYTWMNQHRGEYDILIHPNTGCELEDHSNWAAWGGNVWEINLDAMSHDMPGPWWNVPEIYL